jgi:DNA-binding CsgD family transcriptional regulator
VDVTRRTGDVSSEVQARRFQILVAYGQGRDRAAAVAALAENAAFARTHGLAGSELWADMYLAMVTGRLQDAESARQMSERMGAWFWHTANLEAMLHLMEGRPDVCEAILGRIRREVSPRIIIAAWIAVRQAFVCLHRGYLEEARKLVEGASAASDANSCGWWIASDWSAARGWLAWEEDQLVEACGHLASAAGDDVIGNYWTISPGPVFLPLRVDALVRLSRLDEAALAVSGFEAFGPGRDRFLAAALAAARFRLEPSLELASDAETAAAGAPWPWLHALVGCWRGEFLQETGAAQAARQRFEVIGAQLGIRRAQAVLRGLGVRLPRHEYGAVVLTPREIEVAELVAEGLSNPAIARRLYLSRPTVASHVAHILTKLGFSSRAQIAAWAAQRRAAES